MSELNSGPGAPDNDEQGPASTDTADGPHDAPGAQPDGDTGESGGGTFSGEYVRGLRQEAAEHRTRAKAAEERAEQLSRDLFGARVALTGRLADPTDLDYAPELVDDAEGLATAIAELVAAKPHLARPVVSGDAGQGQRGGQGGAFSLFEALRGDR